MTARILWRLLFFFVIIVGLAVGAAALYQLGYSQGAMTAMAMPEGSAEMLSPVVGLYPGWHYGPRVGLLGFFPLLLCLGGFFFLLMIFGFGFAARRRAWWKCAPGAREAYWKHYGPPPYGPGRPSEEAAQPEKEPESSPPDKEE